MPQTGRNVDATRSVCRGPLAVLRRQPKETCDDSDYLVEKIFPLAVALLVMLVLAQAARALPSDTQQFLSIEDAAKNRLTGGESAKVHPRESSRWFAGVARDVLHEVEQAEKKIGESNGKEFASTVVDLKILPDSAMIALLTADPVRSASFCRQTAMRATRSGSFLSF